MRATLAETMSEDEEWTPPTEAELKVQAFFQKISFVNSIVNHVVLFGIMKKCNQVWKVWLLVLDSQTLFTIFKVLAARRERSDKISKLMGDYMLKVWLKTLHQHFLYNLILSNQGYRMLATLCPLCECVELQDRQGVKYCVACQEVQCTWFCQ